MKRKQVLVVDDDRGMVETLCDILELHGWTTFRAYDGDVAVELASAHRIDVVLMDVRMPRVGGVEALRTIKRRRPSTRVVLMTAFAAKDLLEEAAREGAAHILPKPVDLSGLVGLLEESLREARSVLVVDDEPAFLETLCGVLESRGIRTVEATTIDDAVERMTRETPAAVLLDLKLDGLDPDVGILAIREVSPSVLLILYSGHPADLSATVDRAAPGLVDAAFVKPLPIDDLLALLDGSHDG